MSILLSLLLAPVASATGFDPLFDQAAAEFQVPAPVLKALAFEASRVDPQAASAWGGYGMFDLREDSESDGPGIERVSQLLDVSPDAVMASPELQVRGAAALLHWHAAAQSGGVAPEVGDYREWEGAVQAFSGRHDPMLQGHFSAYIFQVVNDGFLLDGASLLPRSVEPGLLEAPQPLSVGDYYGTAEFIAAHSSNYTNQSRGPSDISTVVIHTVQGSYAGCISWFRNSDANVSAHYVVRSSDGHITQMVYEEDRAWHVGNANSYSVGIEHEGWVDAPNTWYTDAMYRASAELTADIAARNGIPLNRSHIIAHSEAPGATHTDPGSGWDWDRYMDLIGGTSGADTAELLGAVRAEDIYSGEDLVGATVTLVETGETTTVGSNGFYSFSALGVGTWTARASLSGYDDAECVKTIDSASGQYWCSMAMFESTEEPTDDTGEPTDDSGGGDSGVTDDSGEGEGAGRPGSGEKPGSLVAVEELGCSAAPATTPTRSGLFLLALAGLLCTRRRS